MFQVAIFEIFLQAYSLKIIILKRILKTKIYIIKGMTVSKRERTCIVYLNVDFIAVSDIPADGFNFFHSIK